MVCKRHVLNVLKLKVNIEQGGKHPTLVQCYSAQVWFGHGSMSVDCDWSHFVIGPIFSREIR